MTEKFQIRDVDSDDDDSEDVFEVWHTFALFPAAAETKVSESLFNISHNLFTLA